MVLVDTNSYMRAEVWCRKVEVLIYACSGQILTLVKTATHVPQHQKHLKWKTNSTYQLDHCGSREKASGLTPSSHLTQGRSLIYATASSFSDPHSTWGPSLTSATARPLSDYIYLGSFTWIFNSGGTISLVGGPDLHSKGPPRILLPPRWI